MDKPTTDRFDTWLDESRFEGSRRVARESSSTILVSKFEPGFAARLHDAIDRVPELFDIATITSRFRAADGATPRVEAWRLAINRLLDDLAPARNLDGDQLAEIRAGTDSVAALLDATLWTVPTVAAQWRPSEAESLAYAEALARMDDNSSIFTRYYGEFEGRRVENHCPGASIARRLFHQAWAICTET